MNRIVSGMMLTLLLIGMLTLAFNIQPVKASGTIYIRADGSVEPPTANITSADNITYYFTDNIMTDRIYVERDNVVVDGNGYTLEDPSGTGTGFHMGPDGPGQIENATIQNMNIKNFYAGITLPFSSDCAFSGNTISNCDFGFYLAYAYANNIISGNTITNNDCGIFIFWTDDNIIYHNNFIDNAQQVSIDSSSYDIIWDDGYPSGGNYWSDYNGTDFFSGPYQNETGSDGIGDTPHIIDENNTDWYPLMGQLGPLTVVGENVTVFPTDDVCLIFENVTAEGLTVVNKTSSGPEPPSGFMVDQYYRIETSANCSGKITIRIIYDDSNMTQEQEENLQLMQWNETTQEWVNITTYIDTENNVIIGETSHLSMFGVTLELVNYITITEVTPSKTIVGEGYSVTINVTIANQGDMPQTFNVTVYANANAIDLKNVTLASGNCTTITCTWNTTDWAKGNYTISAYATPVPGETDTTDNTLVDGVVTVTIPGDVDGDFDVDIYDIVKICVAYGSKKGDPKYEPNCDINCDGKIDIYDVVIACTHYGQKYP